MIQRPAGIGAFQFVVLTSLRAAQLMRGCRPRVDGTHKAIVLAQVEVAEGKVTQLPYRKVDVDEPVSNASVLDEALMFAHRT